MSILMVSAHSPGFLTELKLKAIKFVMMDGRQRPTPQSSRPIKEGDEFGRGSLVYFNQATMYQPSEIGHATIREAIEAGCSGKVDYGTSAQEAFTKYASLIPVSTADSKVISVNNLMQLVWVTDPLAAAVLSHRYIN
jgi:hypothetical protein